MSYNYSTGNPKGDDNYRPIYSAPPKATRKQKLISLIGLSPIFIVIIGLIVNQLSSHTDVEAAERHYQQGIENLSRRDYSWAASSFSLAIENNRDYAEAYTMRGQAYMALGLDQLALSDFDHAIELNPVLHQAYVNRALFHFTFGDYQLAIDDYTEAIRLKPREPESYVARGGIYDKQGMFALALEDYQAYIRLVGNKAKREIIERATQLEEQLTASSA